jgi:hypothetical protein
MNLCTKKLRRPIQIPKFVQVLISNIKMKITSYPSFVLFSVCFLYTSHLNAQGLGINTTGADARANAFKIPKF